MIDTIDTKVFKVDAHEPDADLIREAVHILQKGGLVAFPTETVYGLGADALNPEAVRKIFTAKGRPSDNPLIVHISKTDQLFDFVDEMPEKGELLIKRFWPGPLTLVVKRTILVSDIVTGGLDTVAVRMPDHAVPLSLVEMLGTGIVGPSANISGRPSPTTANHVLDDLKGKIDLILDAGPTTIGVESTVVDVTVDPPYILRPGGVTRESIESLIGPVHIGKIGEMLKRSPGTRHRHYAPRASIVLIERGNRAQIEKSLQTFRQEGKCVACIVHSPQMIGVEVSDFFRVLPSDHELMARYLYKILRELDQLRVDVILVEEVEEKGLGETVMDRLRKAAEENYSTS